MSDPVVLLSTGDVVGPAGGVTDNSMVLFNGTSGKLIKGNNAQVTAAGLALLDDVNAAAQRVTLGLGNVDNTRDIDKPISTATQTALNLKATIDSPTFTGDPKAPTPAQFDNDTSLMTTNFAKRMGIEHSDFNSINANTALTASSIGGLVSAASAVPINVTLPPTAGVPHGATVLVVNSGTGAVTLLASGTDLTTNQSGSTVSIVLGFCDSALFVKVAGEWRLESGSAALKYAASFGASLAANGYQKLPSGLIIQWGYSASSNGVTTLPITFPSANLIVLATPAYPGAAYSGQVKEDTASRTLNSIVMRGYTTTAASVTTAAHNWLAIGY